MIRVEGVLRNRTRTRPPWTETTNPTNVGVRLRVSLICTSHTVKESAEPIEVTKSEAACVRNFVIG